MSKIRVAFLSALALLTASGIFASTGSASGPYWHVGGAKLTQGAKQIKLQSKGIYVQRVKFGGLPVIIECRTGLSEGGTIEGKGLEAGQGKLRLALQQCHVTNLEGCAVLEPVLTQVKLYLVTYAGSQSKYALLFDAGQFFITFHFTSTPGHTCGIGSLPIRGPIAAEIAPKEQESQEMHINFPENAISPVFLEQLEVKLPVSEAETTAASFGARLSSGERFGVFGQ